MKGMNNLKIVLENIVKKFDGNNILTDINIDFTSGKIYGLIGRNGSGKSVLLKIVCGFYAPTTGKVLVDDIDIVQEKRFLPNVRVLIEKPTFLPDISGIENLRLLAKIQNKISEDKINETLDRVNLSIEDRNKKYHKYSLGMKQKLGIAQVLMEDPDIMILDEPFNGVEKETTEKIRKVLKEEKKKGKIIILASHIKEDIEELADVVYEIDAGKIEKIR